MVERKVHELGYFDNESDASVADVVPVGLHYRELITCAGYRSGRLLPRWQQTR